MREECPHCLLLQAGLRSAPDVVALGVATRKPRPAQQWGLQPLAQAILWLCMASTDFKSPPFPEGSCAWWGRPCPPCPVGRGKTWP